MKWIKKFESRKNLKVNITSDVSSKEKMIGEWEDVDMFSSVTFDEFFDRFPFDFHLPEGHIHNDFYDCGISIATECSKKFAKVMSSKNIYCMSYEFGSKCPDFVKNDINPNFYDDWSKRNVVIFAYVNTGGYSGGSCYDEDNEGATPYDGNDIDIDIFLAYLKHFIDCILYSHTNTKSSDELISIISNKGIIHNSLWTNHEYYGNSDDYECYYITLYDLFRVFSENDCF